MIEAPFLIYLGSSTDSVGIKTSRGLATFRRADCVGEFREDDCPLTLDLARMSMQQAVDAGAKTMVVGISNPGGTMDAGIIAHAAAALEAGMNVAAGLHQRLNEIPQLVEMARQRNVTLHDVRDPPRNLIVGNGRPRSGRRLLTVGTDCSVGKMYASLALVEGMQSRGINARFRATGQTGILIAGEGIPIDAVISDFISGAAEQLAPARSDDGWDVIEGQGSLFHPSFAGVSTGLLHGSQPEAIVLCHDPARTEMRGLPGRAMPALAQCLAANLQTAQLTSPNVRAVGICLNTSSYTDDVARDWCARTADTMGLPCTDPHRYGVDLILDNLLCTAPSQHATTASS